jgi:hypothetical protein
MLPPLRFWTHEKMHEVHSVSHVHSHEKLGGVKPEPFRDRHF